MPSTVIASMRYDKQAAALEVFFLTGSIYRYLGVPEKVFDAMKRVTSKGSYLNRHIKGRYAFEKIK